MRSDCRYSRTISVYGYTVTQRQGQSSVCGRGMTLLASNVLSSDANEALDGWNGSVSLDHAAGSGFIVGWSLMASGDALGRWTQARRRRKRVWLRQQGPARDWQNQAIWRVRSDPRIPKHFPDEGPNEDSPIHDGIRPDYQRQRLRHAPRRCPAHRRTRSLQRCRGTHGTSRNIVETDLVSECSLIDPALRSLNGPLV